MKDPLTRQHALWLPMVSMVRFSATVQGLQADLLHDVCALERPTVQSRVDELESSLRTLEESHERMMDEILSKLSRGPDGKV